MWNTSKLKPFDFRCKCPAETCKLCVADQSRFNNSTEVLTSVLRVI